MPASHELLAPFDVAIRALRPNWAKPDPEVRKELLRLGWKVLEEKGSSSQEGIWKKLERTMAERGGVVDPKQSELSRGIFDELPPWKVFPCGFVSICSAIQHEQNPIITKGCGRIGSSTTSSVILAGCLLTTSYTDCEGPLMK
jgi:hypothetical protein